MNARLDCALAVAVWLVLLVPPVGAAGEGPGPGQYLERVACQNDPGQTYALYLPSAYTPSRSWPILYLFHPGARGGDAVRRFQAAAERYGWIVAGSNNSRNGPWAPIAEAARAMWLDSNARLPLDRRRIYAGGFSGGARVASTFAFTAGQPLAGIIACGAGPPRTLRPRDVQAAAFLGVVGLGDPNYEELKTVGARLQHTGISQHLIVFDGTHQWPDPATCERAVAWMEAQAIRAGLRTADTGALRWIYHQEVAAAAALEQAGSVGLAVAAYDGAAALLEGEQLNTAAAQAQRLRRSEAFRSFPREEKSRQRRETKAAQRVGRVLASLERGSPDDRALLEQLQVASLKEQACRARALEERALASRILLRLQLEAMLLAERSYHEGALDRAAPLLELAIAACREDDPQLGRLRFNLACVRARRGETNAALENLRAALASGFADREAIERDADLDSLRALPAYHEILAQIDAGQ